MGWVQIDCSRKPTGTPEHAVGEVLSTVAMRGVEGVTLK